MTATEIVEIVKSRFGEAVLDSKTEAILEPFIKVTPSVLPEICSFLAADTNLVFDYLMCLSGVDLGKGNLGVTYHLFSTVKRHKITVKVEVPVATPEVPSVSSIWRSADWHEREAYDLVGVVFTGHPDLRRILLPEDWEGHPLRKDYKVPEFYQGMKVPY